MPIGSAEAGIYMLGYLLSIDQLIGYGPIGYGEIGYGEIGYGEILRESLMTREI